MSTPFRILIVAIFSLSDAIAQPPFTRAASPYREGTILPKLSKPQLDKSVDSLYALWKVEYIKDIPGSMQSYILFVNPRHPSQICTSEGQGYGMLILALMGRRDASAQASFDRLLNFRDAHQSSRRTGLMCWKELKRGHNIRNKDTTAATDGDVDIAYSLLLAAKVWPSERFGYLKRAKAMITKIMQFEINHDKWTVLMDDCEEHLKATTYSKEYISKGFYDTRSSDFMPATFREFSQFDKDWLKVDSACYELFNIIQEKYCYGTGLVPDFIRHVNFAVPVPAKPYSIESEGDGKYFNNACRIPWRLSVDFLQSGQTAALSFINRINTFIRTKAKDDTAKIYAGYELNGDQLNNDNENFYTAPFTVSAMSSGDNQKWLDDLWVFIIKPHHFMKSSKDLDYFGDNIRLIVVIIASGNYWPAFRDI